MKREYKSEDEIQDLVRSFEEATVSREEWHHAEHMIVALYYLERHDSETTTAKMREGIFKLLRAFNVDLSKEMPYHETLTRFWMRTIEEFNSSRGGMRMVEKVSVLLESFDKDYPLKFYSRERLFSDEARAGYVEPDLV